MVVIHRLSNEERNPFLATPQTALRPPGRACPSVTSVSSGASTRSVVVGGSLESLV